MGLLDALEHLRRRLQITKWCMLMLSSDVGMRGERDDGQPDILMNPNVANINDFFTNTLTSLQLQKLHVFFKQNEAVINLLPITPAAHGMDCDLPSDIHFNFSTLLV